MFRIIFFRPYLLFDLYIQPVHSQYYIFYNLLFIFLSMQARPIMTYFYVICTWPHVINQVSLVSRWNNLLVWKVEYHQYTPQPQLSCSLVQYLCCSEPRGSIGHQSISVWIKVHRFWIFRFYNIRPKTMF